MSEVQEREGTRLIFADDTEIEDGKAGYYANAIWCYMTGITLHDAATIFFDTNKTSKIVFQYGEMESTFEGFTTCTNLMIDVDGVVSVRLERANHA